MSVVAALRAKPLPTAALLLVGNEILAGDVADANGPYVLRSLRRRGVETVEIRAVPDDVAAIVAAVRALAARADALFVVGGIGPTHDDVTLAAVSLALGVPLVQDPELEARVRAHFAADLPAQALRLARVPAGATVRFGRLRLVPLLEVAAGSQDLAAALSVLPGVPRLLRLALDDTLGDAPLGPAFLRQDFLVRVEEPRLVAQLEALQMAHPNVQIGSYPNFDAAGAEVRISLQGRAQTALAQAATAVLAVWPTAEVLLPR